MKVKQKEKESQKKMKILNDLEYKINYIAVMKKTAIDLSSLTEAQKKMCVQLLAKGNFQFDPQSNGYQATLKIPNNQAKEFSTNVAKDKNK